MFDHKPTQQELAKWFAGFKLHDGLDHSRYISGIVVIENKDRGGSLWTPYVNATSRITYFWDWVQRNGYAATIETTGPHEKNVIIPNVGGSPQDPERVVHHFFMAAEVLVIDPNREQSNIVRKATARKQVDNVVFRRGFNGAPGRFSPDTNAVMKGETGAVARALGMIGMLTLPDSGLATAEDMVDFLAMSDHAKAPAEESQAKPVHSSTEGQKRAVPNPKK